MGKDKRKLKQIAKKAKSLIPNEALNIRTEYRSKLSALRRETFVLYEGLLDVHMERKKKTTKKNIKKPRIRVVWTPEFDAKLILYKSQKKTWKIIVEDLENKPSITAAMYRYKKLIKN